MSYTLYINQKEKIAEYPLPAVDNKRIGLDISDICGCTLTMEILDGVWRLLSDSTVTILTDRDGGAVQYAELSDGAVIWLMCNNSMFAVMAKEIHAEQNSYSKYQLGKKISIGRAADNDIVINDDFTGSHHCVIVSDNGRYVLSDNSKNGTYINGRRVSAMTELHIFDTIYITGHKLIFLGSVIAVCDSDSVSSALPAAELDVLTNKELHSDSSYFSRAPRRICPLDTETVEIDDPPSKQKMRSQPLIFIIGPSVTMPIPILVSVVVNIVSSSSSGHSGMMYLGTALSVILSALIGTGWALAHQMYNKKQLAADEKERTEAYTKYIEKNKKLLEEKQEKNRKILEENYLSFDKLSYAAGDDLRLIWNRNIYQEDFLTIRLGRGKIKMPAQISVSKQRFSMNDDPLSEYPHKLHDKYELIENGVSAVSLFKYKIIGIVGNAGKLPLIVNNIICQTAALHCYTDVKIGFIANSSEKALYSWAKWLPHTFMGGGEVRIFGFDEDTRASAVYEIAGELRRRTENAENSKDKICLPHIVLFCTSPELIRNSILSKYLTSPNYLGITFVLIYGNINKLPNECSAVIEASADFSGFYCLNSEITDENRIKFDEVPCSAAEDFARKISRFYVDETRSGVIPKSVDFFEMIGIGRTEHWDLIRQYKCSRSYEGIKSFIGLGSGGTPVVLDIHDKKDGPHGLVAGTTGSGKSETLQTFILSIAMNYSPEDAAFVLIDYKGGGMANVFEGLPHIAGMITNLSDAESGELDSGLTRRACSSLKSEVRRRQAVFKEYGVNHIDAYSRLYREGRTNIPMPHLIIISDEFAELKKEQPDFIKELVSISRVGRSLGVHLILATQKPSGVVDDEIQGNSRFRICLRVQDKQDSTGMIMRPDAAFITEAGRAFLQIGNDEIFEEFQSGYSGGEYIPHDKVESAEDSEAAMIAMDGRPAVVHIRGKFDGDRNSEITEMVRYISETSASNNIKCAKTLWLPPLGKYIYLNDEYDRCSDGITALYGIADNYEQQEQFPCYIDIEKCANIKICGSTGSGKTTLLQTILVSIVKKYSPERFNFYVMDFSSRTFKLFKRLPHCGGVIYEEENDAAERLIRLISDEIRKRKRLFEKEDIGSYREYIKLHKLPLIVIAIDNFSGFSERFESLEEDFEAILHECVRYGIQFIVTISSISDIKYKIRSNISDSIVLRLNDKSDYSEFLGRPTDFLPAAVSGRGLMSAGKTVTEFQSCLPVDGDNESERSANLKKLFASLSEKYSGIDKAAPIPLIPNDALYSELLENNNLSDALIVGYEAETAQPYSLRFTDFYCMCISDCAYSGIGRFMSNTIVYSVKNNIAVKVIRCNHSIDINIPDGVDVFETKDDIYSLAEYLTKEFSQRNRAVPLWQKDERGMTRDGFMADRFGRIFVIIDDIAQFCDIIYNDAGAELVNGFMQFIKMGKDHGVHFFGGYSSARKTYLGVSEAFRAENHGIHFGGRVNDQSVLNIEIPLAEKFKTLKSNIGFSVESGRVVTVFVPENK